MRHDRQNDQNRPYGYPQHEQNRWTEPNVMGAHDAQYRSRYEDDQSYQGRGQIRQNWDNDYGQGTRDEGAYRTNDEPRYREPSNTGYRQNQSQSQYGPQGSQQGYSQGYSDRGQNYASGTGPSYGQGDYSRQDYGQGGSYGPSTYRPAGPYAPNQQRGYSDDAPSSRDPYSPNTTRGVPASPTQSGWGQGASGIAGAVMGNRSYAGRGPKGYTRSDERLQEEINDVLTRDHHLDASEIEVSVESGEVTLTGTVCCRSDKFHAEQLVDSVTGVRDVTNRLRVDRSRSDDRNDSGSSNRTDSERNTASTGARASGSSQTDVKNSRSRESSKA